MLEYQKNEQIIIKFFPQESCPYHSEAILKYDDLISYVDLRGTAYTGNVYLSKQHLKLEKTYIGL